jgi:hypothetical protein
MKIACTLSIALLLLVPSAVFAQNNAAANRRWPGFWRQFTAAVRNKNRVGIKRLMSAEADFITVGGISNRNDFLRMFEDKGTMSYTSQKGRPARRTKDRYLIFEYIGGRWRFIGLMGD